LHKCSIVRLEGIDDRLSCLLEQSKAEGHRHLQRLVDEYQSGDNRFDRPGELLLAAVDEDRMIGVCGLNRNPYGERQDIGRVRRLYILQAYRRQGVASRLMEAVVDEAKKHYSALVLFTDQPAADVFYRSIGFSAGASFEKATHYLEWGRK